MIPSPRNLVLDILELETAFEALAAVDPYDGDEPCISFLDLTTGKIITPEGQFQKLIKI